MINPQYFGMHISKIDEAEFSYGFDPNERWPSPGIE